MSKQADELQVDYDGKKYRLSIEQRRNSGDLLVFLHGWGCNKECFAEAFSSEELGAYDICTLDLLGFGKSEKPEDFTYDLLDQANIVALAVKSLRAKRVYLVGHSMGGGIGLLATPLLKESIAVFISVEGNLASTDSSAVTRSISRQPFWLFRILTFPAIKFLALLNPDRSMRFWGRWCREASPLGFYKSAQSLVSWSDSGKLLPMFNYLPRKAYIYGEHGIRKENVVPKLSKPVTYEITSSGHIPMVDNAGEFYATIAKIIQNV